MEPVKYRMLSVRIPVELYAALQEHIFKQSLLEKKRLTIQDFVTERIVSALPPKKKR